MQRITLDPPTIEELRDEFLRIGRTIDAASTYADAASIRQYLVEWSPRFFELVAGLADAAQRVIAPGARFSPEPIHQMRVLAREIGEGLLHNFDQRPAGHHLSPEEFEQWTMATWVRDREALLRRLRDRAQKLWKAMREASEEVTRRGSVAFVEREVPRPYRLAGFDVALMGDVDGTTEGPFLRAFDMALRTFRERLERMIPGAIDRVCPIVVAWGRGYGPDALGQYIPALDRMEVYPEAFGGMSVRAVVAVVAHEMGHHFWRRVLEATGRREWSDFVEESLVTLDAAIVQAAWEVANSEAGEAVTLIELAHVLRATDPRLALQVAGLLYLDGPWRENMTREQVADVLRTNRAPRVMGQPITAYGHKNPEEAFCEAMSLLIAYGGRTLNPAVRQWLRTVIPAARTERLNDATRANHAHAATGCSCGTSDAHVIAHRMTADGVRVELWDNGAVTGGYGLALPGVPIVRPKTPDARRVALEAAWMVAGDVALYDASEVAALYATARKVAQRGGGVADFHAALREPGTDVDAPRLALHWNVYETDRSGRTTVRVARLDRMRWPGLAVWHEKGKYQIMHVDRFATTHGSSEVLRPTGISFGSQRELVAHLFAHPTGIRTKDNSAVAARDFWRHREVTKTSGGETYTTTEGYSLHEPPRLTDDHWSDPAVSAARTVANYTTQRTYTLRPWSDEAPGVTGVADRIGQGNFGLVYRVQTLDGMRRVKIPAPYDLHDRTWTWEKQRENLLHDAGVSNELRALGVTVVPEQVYTEFGGTPAVVGEWGEPVVSLTGAEYGAIEQALTSIERDHQWRVRDDLQVYRRHDGTVYVGDVGLWGAPDPARRWNYHGTELPMLLDKLQKQTLSGLAFDADHRAKLEPRDQWLANVPLYNLPELLWKIPRLREEFDDLQEDPARFAKPALQRLVRREAEDFLQACEDRTLHGIPNPDELDEGEVLARSILERLEPTKTNDRTRADLPPAWPVRYGVSCDPKSPFPACRPPHPQGIR